MSIKKLLEYILKTLKLTHDFFHNDCDSLDENSSRSKIVLGVSHPGMSKFQVVKISRQSVNVFN